MRKQPISAVIIILGILGMILGEALGGRSEDKIAELFSSSYEMEERGKYNDAFLYVLQILKLNSRHYYATLRAGWLSHQAKEYDNSAKYYEKAVALRPRAVEPRLGLMLPLMAMQDWEGAERVGKEILRKAPGNYAAASRLAYICFCQGEYGEAESRYRSILVDYPGDQEMILGLGWTYFRQGRDVEAKKMFRLVLAFSPENDGALTGLASLE